MRKPALGMGLLYTSTWGSKFKVVLVQNFQAHFQIKHKIISCWISFEHTQYQAISLLFFLTTSCKENLW
jgi:hypothetical protein